MGLANLVRHSERALLPVLPRSLTLWLEGLYFGRFGEAELALLPRLARPGWDAIDVGGHEGEYSLFLRKLARRVHLFEPLPDMAAHLRRKFGDSVEIHEVALSASAGQAVLHFPRHHRFGDPSALASLNAEAVDDGGDMVEITVRTRRLDDYGLDRVGLIKIDVEGHEEAVLDGARATIERCRPNLIVEIEERHAKGALARISARFAAMGYDCLYLHEGRLVPLGNATVAELQASGNPFLPGFYIRNFIFLPREGSG